MSQLHLHGGVSHPEKLTQPQEGKQAGTHGPGAALVQPKAISSISAGERLGNLRPAPDWCLFHSEPVYPEAGYPKIAKTA
uniref:Uncharacterized protein n=1 Tax=Sphaerodactylus townsendi TaxID=933632 RepID=A0ACB8EDF5_9SAUR